MTEQPGQIVQVAPQATAQQQNLLTELKEQPNFLAVRYNEQKQKKTKSSRMGGAYVPPHKLRAMQQKLLQQDPNSVDHQRMMWELLRKSINGIVNKVNIANIQNIVIELFNENLLRGVGLLTKAIIKAQMASPNFTHVYAALISVINTKLPQIGSLLATRVMLMFKRSFHRNNKIVCMATTKMLAHLINQRVLGEFAGLQMLMILLMRATQDSVQIACDFMTQVGQVLSQVSPAAASAIFERFKNLLHEGQIGQKAQYSIQKLFAVRKTGFKNHPGVIPELDLVQAEDQITHNLDFQQQLAGQQNLNFFKQDPNYQQNEQEWDKIKLQILGQQNIINLKQVAHYQQQVQQYNKEEEEQGIKDLTQQDLINLRRTIYLAIQSTVNFQQCAHKILKMNITKGYQSQLIDMIIQCCMMERIYQQFFGLLSERFCKIDDMYKELFIQAFVNYYNTVFKLQANKVRNLAKLYGHLFYTFSIDWKIMQVITLRQDTTTSAHRMFLKIMFREIAQNLGIDKMAQQFNNPQMRQYYSGLFPIGHPNDVRFAINYWTTIGLGKLTQEMRQVLDLQQQMIADRKSREEQQKIQQLMKQQQQMLMAQQMERKQLQQRIKINQQNQKLKRQKKFKRQRERERDDQEDQQNFRRVQVQLQKHRHRSRQRKARNRSYSNSSKSRSREKDNYREKQRQRQRKKRQKSRSKSRERQRERDRDREREKQREREREREKQKYRQKQRQRQKQIEIQKQKEKQKEREREREKLKQRQQQKQRERQRQKERQRERQKQRQKEKEKQKRKKSSSQSEQQQSSSQSQSEETPKIRKQGDIQKNKAKAKREGQKKRVQSSDSQNQSQSSGISSDSENQNAKGAEVKSKNAQQKSQINKNKQSQSDSSSQSSDSSQSQKSQESPDTPPRRKRQPSNERSRRKDRRRREPSQDESSGNKKGGRDRRRQGRR